MNFPKCNLTKFADAVSLSCGNHEVVRFRLLKHRVHRTHVIFGMTPITFSFKIADPQLGGKAEFYSRNGAGRLASYKLKPAPRALMVEQNSTDTKESVR